MSKFSANQDRDPAYGRRMRRRIERGGNRITASLGFGSEPIGIDAEWQDIRKVKTIFDSTTPSFGGAIEFHINPNEAHYLRNLYLLLNMKGSLVGAGGATQLAYPEGIAHIIDRVEFLLLGGKVFYTIPAGEVLANAHEIYDNRDKYDVIETNEGFGSLATRVTQLGTGITYRLWLRSFLDGMNLFPLGALDKEMIVRVYFRSGPPIEVDTGTYASAAGFNSVQLECWLRNGPEAQIQRIENTRRRKGVFFHTMETFTQRKAISSGSTTYAVPFTGINGINHTFVWTLRATTDLNSYKYTTLNSTVTKWNLFVNKAPVLASQDLGLDPTYQLGEYLLDKFGKKMTTHYVHAYTWSILQDDNHPHHHIIGGHYTFSPGNDYELTFTLSGALASDSVVDFYGVNVSILYIAPNGEIESEYY